MGKVLEKSLKDARKEDRLVMGTRQVLGSVKDSKLIILSKSLGDAVLGRIRSEAGKGGVPLVDFDGTSVGLGRLCGLQFRVSTVSFSSIPDSNVKSIIKDAASGQDK